MLLVGLTGGVACGKSTVASALGALPDVHLVDLDALSHSISAPGTRAHALMCARWPQCVAPSGELDRAAVGAIVFADAHERLWLNSITHWRIGLALARVLLTLWARGASCVVLDAPLLYQTGLHHLCGAVLAVSVPPAVQRVRVQRRDGVDETTAEHKVAASALPPWASPTVVLDNTGPVVQTREAAVSALALLRRRTRWQLPSRTSVAVACAVLAVALLLW